MPTILLPKKVRLPSEANVVGTGWLPPTYDNRDYTDTHPEVAPLVTMMMPAEGAAKSLKASPPTTVDLRQYCSPIESQGGLGSCTANAAAGIVEYFEKRSHKKYIDGSRLFIYKTTRNLMGVSGDTGAWLRNTMGALALCGVADEKYWPYTDASPDFDTEPPAFVYSIAHNFDALRYFCHDPLSQPVPAAQVIANVKKYLAAGIPSMFGFWGYASSLSSDVVGAFPLPDPSEPIEWGHAVAAVGYDDNITIKNTQHSTISSKGAFLIRNSWGTSFGDAGYGWIPYDYVQQNRAMDFWSLIRLGWVDTGQFQF